jgi:benzil reductase ((S)-benzoin forming)
MTTDSLPCLALVTGTSRGIGRAIVPELLAAGFEVVGVSRNAPDERLGPGYRHYRCDLGDLDAVARLFEDVIPAEVPFASRQSVGLVNNAAILDLEPVHKAALTSLERAYRINAVVPAWLHGWLLRHTTASQRVRIVDVSSGAAVSAIPGWSAYCATKAALRMAGQVLGTELDEIQDLAGRDVAIVSYAPGVVATDMQARIRGAELGAFPRRRRFDALHAERQLLEPAVPAKEIAALLQSDEHRGFSERRVSCDNRS